MAIFLPTKQNMCVLKSILMDLFEMRSAHASEAIASLIGFRSNANFLNTSNTLPDVTVYAVDFDAFVDRSVHLGYERNSAEYLIFIFQDINWPNHVWKMFKKRDVNARGAWFRECERRRIPFIHISRSTKYFGVHWDHMSMDREYDQMVKHVANGELTHRLYKNFVMLNCRDEQKGFFEGSALVGDVTGLTESRARQIANSFAKLLFPGNVRSDMAA